ncbi:MAG: sodium:proton antiporter, partial [Aeromonas veronii]
IKATRLSEAFDWAQYQVANPGAIPLFVMDGKGKPHIVTGPVTPQAGEQLIALQPPREQGAE